MSSPQHADPLGEVILPQPRGTWSLALGAAAVAAIGCPFLPESVVSPQMRFVPAYFVVPLGIFAVVSAAVALRRMRGEEGANRGRARAGLTLGTVALVVALVFVVWACWSLSHVYD